MRRNGKRLAALALALVMVFSLLPVSALAARMEPDEIAIEAPAVSEDKTATPAGAADADAPATLAAEDGPDYTTNNINAGLFDVGATVSGNASSGWTATYTNNLSGSSTDNNRTGSVITATAPSYVNVPSWNDGPPWVAVDGPHNPSSGLKQFYTAYFNASSGNGTYHVDDISTMYTNGTNSNSQIKPEYRYIELKIETGAEELGGIRYYGGKDNTSVVTKCKVQYKANESDSWHDVSLTSDTMNTTLEWKLITFSTPVTAQYIRFYGVNVASSSGYMSIGEIRLVKAAPPVVVEIKGTVTSDGSTPVEGAAVSLVQANDHYTNVTAVTPVLTGSDGSYTLDAHALSAGNYKVRVSKAGHGAVIGSTSIALTGNAMTSNGNNITLPAFDDSAYVNAGYDIKTIDFSDPDAIVLERPAGASATVTPSIANGILTLTYGATAGFPGAKRDNNFTLIGGTPMMNGEIEFDATRQNGDRRFGLTFRMKDTSHMIFVGQFNGSSKWGHEHWNGSGNNVWAENNTVNNTYEPGAPSFGPNETRHFKIKIQGEQVSLWIDGIAVYENRYVSKGDGSTSDPNKQPVMEAGSVGFSYGGTDSGDQAGDGVANEVITVDNLRIVRFDPAFAVTFTAQDSNGSISLVNKGDGNSNDSIATGGRVAEGDKIVVTGTPSTGYDLAGVEVTKTDDSTTTVAVTKNTDGTFSFTMPSYPVTVTPTFLPTFTVTFDETNLQVGQTVTATLSPTAAADHVTYQWQHLNNADRSEQWIDCTNATSATKTITSEDEGKKIRVIVTGDDEAYTGVATHESTGQVSAADVPVSSVVIGRESITMYLNDSTLGNTGNTVGTSTTITTTISPAGATTPIHYNWEIVDVAEGTPSTDGAITFTNADANSMAITAAKPGTVRLKVTATNAGNGSASDTVLITVRNKVTAVTIKNGSTVVDAEHPLVVYTNDADGAGTVLTAELTPSDGIADADKQLIWVRPEGAQGMIRLDRSNPETADAFELTAASATIYPVGGETNVGEVTVEVRVPNSTVKTSFKVEVRRRLAHDVGIRNASGTETFVFGQAMAANVDALVMTAEGKAALTYNWYRADTNSFDDAGKVKIDSASGKGETYRTYTPVAADVDKYILVEVVPDVTTHYEGTKTAVTASQVSKAAGPAVTEIEGVTVGDNGIHGVSATAAGNDGKIVGFPADKATLFEYKAAADNTYDAVTGTEITGLTPGEYNVRVKATDTHFAGTAITVTVADYTQTLYTINIGSMTNGTVTRQRGQAAEGEERVLTVRPNEGYKLTEGSLKVTGTSGDVSLTKGDPVTEGDTTFETYKFNMPAENVMVTASFELKKVKISHELPEHLSCSITEHDADGNHVVDWGEVHSITFQADEGYELPTSEQITITPNISHQYIDGEITFALGVREDITITVTGPLSKKSYTVQYTLTAGGLTGPSGAQSVTHGETYTGGITANQGFSLPETITVTMGGTTLTAGTDYTYNAESGEIEVANVTGNLVITAAGVADKTPVTAVTLSGDAKAGHTLSATVEPEGATVTYQWYRDDVAISGAETRQYTLTDSDIGKVIKVVVTGTDSYAGSQEASSTTVAGPDPTGVSITAGDTATLEFGKTLQLTAVVIPNSATDKTVTWTSLDETVATVSADGVVTAQKVGSVQIRATDAAGHTDTCEVTVTPAQVTLTLSGTAAEGQTLTVNVGPAGVQIRELNWYRVLGGSAIALETNQGQTTYTLQHDDIGAIIRVNVVTTGDNVTGSASVESEPVIDAASLVTVTGVTLDQETASVKVGQTVTLAATVAPENATNKKVVWTSSAPAVATISEDGVVTGVSEGTATITVTTMDGSKTDTCEVTVTAGDVAPTELTLTASPASLTTAGTVTLTVALPEIAANGHVAIICDDLTVSLVASAETPNTWTVELPATEKTYTFTATLAATEEYASSYATCTVTVSKGGSSRPSGGSSNGSSTSTSTVTNKDGSTTTTVTDHRTGTVTQTTKKPDGTVAVVETKKDGTVTTTVTDPKGNKTEKVTDPEKNVTITSSNNLGEELAQVKLPAAIGEPDTKFEDVPAEHWAEDAINHVAALGLVNGVGENRYDMPSPMTRGALATVLYRLSNGKSGYRFSFTDVVLNHYYTEGIAWAAKVGVVTGFSDEIFAPEQSITREQLAVMMARYAKLVGLDTTADPAVLDGFSDSADTGAWATDGVAWCVQVGILQGKGNDTLDPTANVTRAEVAVMLDRFIALLK